MRYPIHYADAHSRAYGGGMRDTVTACGKFVSGRDLEAGYVKRTTIIDGVTCSKCLKALFKKTQSDEIARIIKRREIR